VVWRLGRRGRSLRHLIDTVTALDERGVGVPVAAGVDRHDDRRGAAGVSPVRCVGPVRAGDHSGPDDGGAGGGQGPGSQRRPAFEAERGPGAGRPPVEHTVEQIGGIFGSAAPLYIGPCATRRVRRTRRPPPGERPATLDVDSWAAGAFVIRPGERLVTVLVTLAVSAGGRRGGRRRPGRRRCCQYRARGRVRCRGGRPSASTGQSGRPPRRGSALAGEGGVEGHRNPDRLERHAGAVAAEQAGPGPTGRNR